MKPQLDEKYYLFKELDKAGNNSQRAMAKEMGISLGKINFILKALIAKGWVKMENFAQSENKISYRYILTPEGIKEKVRITKAFLIRKEEEYEKIRQEIEQAREEMQN
ncbi:MarR family EPS-associated transcriptional regulator [bacterium]|nr:MarR family EPS-associated transcriptional regulator [bacterium]